MSIGLFIFWVGVGLVTLLLAGLAARIRKYGKGWWVNHQKRRLQESVDLVVETLTKTNGGNSIIDRFNHQDAKLESFDLKLEKAAEGRMELVKNAEKISAAVAANERLYAQYRDSNDRQMSELNASVNSLSTIALGTRAHVDAGVVVIKTVDDKITENSGTTSGIGDAVGRIEEAQAAQVARETA
jgi:ABC-type multidrug transport system fused ATPase/permease subunit